MPSTVVKVDAVGKVFLDTNVVVYANDARDPGKQERAIAVIEDAIRTRNGVVSTQVLQEYAVVADTRLSQDPDAILRQLRALESLEVVLIAPQTIRRALEIRLRYQIGYWDACILAAAEWAACAIVLSEDLNPGQLYAGMQVQNPFGADT